jgi:asparagine synthase (glutamine-hydrolysing)
MQLKWTDRNSMAHGVESRAPFLDYRVVEYARSLPVAFKLENGIAKRVLRAAMKSIVPDKILSRRDKIGFATPEAQWVRRDRPEWFRSMLARAVAASDGILTPAATQYGDAVIDGHRPFNSRVWRMICFGAWMERFDVRRAG